MILESFPFLIDSINRSLMIVLQNSDRYPDLTIPLLVDSSQLFAVVAFLYLLLPGPF